MATRVGWVGAAAVVLLASAASCGRPEAEVLQEKPAKAPSLPAAVAPLASVEPLTLNFNLPRQPGVSADQSQKIWQRRLQHWRHSFNTALSARLPNAHLRLVSAGAPVDRGLAVRVAVRRIERHWSLWTGGADAVVADLTVLDPTTAQVIYRARLRGSSRGVVGPKGWGFVGRIEHAMAGLGTGVAGRLRARLPFF